MSEKRTVRKRRVLVAVLCLALILGLPIFWMIRGSENISIEPNIRVTPPATPPPAQPSSPEFDRSKYSLSDATSPWVVVNKQRPINPLKYAPTDLVILPGGQYLRRDAAAAYTEMSSAAAQLGLALNAASGYRSYDTQVFVYNKEVQTNGKAAADSQSARPSYSEHQTGQALDLSGGGCNIEDCFATTAEGKWAASNAYKYGFLLRYPPGKTEVTGYRAEPWHFRYIGKELAAQMHTNSILTLEEFFSLPAAPGYL